MILVAILALLACSGGDSEDSAASGQAGDTSSPTGDTRSDVSFDECAAVVGDAVPEARSLGSYANETAVYDDDLAVIADSDALAAWLDGTGLNPDDFAAEVDFETEQIVGLIWPNGLSEGDPREGRWLSGFDWTADHVSMVGIVEAYEPCVNQDDAMATVQVWVTPIAAVSSCDVGVRCE